MLEAELAFGPEVECWETEGRSWMAKRQSAKLPTSTMPPERPRPPKGVHTIQIMTLDMEKEDQQGVEGKETNGERRRQPAGSAPSACCLLDAGAFCTG